MTRIENICPRCGGNLFLEREEYDQHFYCLQCGFRAEPGKINGVNYKANEGRREILHSQILKRGEINGDWSYQRDIRNPA